MADSVAETVALMERQETKYLEALSGAIEAATDLAVANVTDPGYRLPQSAYGELIHPITGVWVDTVAGSISITREALAQSSKAADGLEQIMDRFNSTHAFPRIQAIGDTTVSIVRQKVRRAMARGLSRDEALQQLLNESPQIARTRAETIVRTEAHLISQYTSQIIAQQSGILLRKVWNSVNDSRTRDFGPVGDVSSFNHRAMNGQTRPLLDQFSVPTRLGGFERLSFPGDPAGSPGNTINCRCVQTYEEAL